MGMEGCRGFLGRKCDRIRALRADSVPGCQRIGRNLAERFETVSALQHLGDGEKGFDFPVGNFAKVALSHDRALESGQNLAKRRNAASEQCPITGMTENYAKPSCGHAFLPGKRADREPHDLREADAEFLLE